MVVLWVVALLSIAIFSTSQLLFVELESQANSSAIFNAEQLADRGLALAAHPQVENGDPLLQQEVSEYESFSARIGSEGALINLNFFLAVPERRIVLEELFFQWGLRGEEAAKVVDSLIDWVDSDNDSTNSGAEQSYYLSQEKLNQPYNRRFATLDEVPLVADFKLLTSIKPDWKNFFTLLSGGPLDLSDSSPDLISAVCECPLETARQLVSTRDGTDGLPGTIDDVPLESVEVALTLLQIPQGSLETIQPRVTLNDPVRRIISVGQVGAIAVERSVTIRYTGDQGKILQWKTRRIDPAHE